MVKKKIQKKITKKKLLKLAKKERNKLDKEWRETLKKEFRSSCAICGRTDIIHCHHIIPREIKAFRHEQLNGICLCPKHHKFSTEISPHKNGFVFFNWYQKKYPERYKKLFALFLRHIK